MDALEVDDNYLLFYFMADFQHSETGVIARCLIFSKVSATRCTGPWHFPSPFKRMFNCHLNEMLYTILSLKHSVLARKLDTPKPYQKLRTAFHGCEDFGLYQSKARQSAHVDFTLLMSST